MDNFYGYQYDPNFNRQIQPANTIEYQQNKKSLKRTCAKLGGLLLLYNILTRQLSYFFYFAVYRIYSGKFTLNFEVVRNYLLEEKEELLDSTSFVMAANLSISLTGMLIVMLFGKLILKIDLDGYFKPSLKAMKKGVQWAPPCFMVNMVCSIAVFMITAFLSTQGITVPEADFTISDPSAASVLMQTAYVVLLAPIIEETIYRGLILGMLSKYGKAPAVLLSALAFGLMHGNIPQAASAFAAGLFFAIIAVNCNSIVPTIIIHMLNNLIANFTDVFEVLKIKQGDLILCIIEMTILLLACYILLTRYRALRFDTNNILNEKGKVGYIVFTNPVIVIYLLFMVFSIVSGLIKAN